MIVLTAVLAAIGLTLSGLGTVMWSGRIPPNRWVGFRTPRTLSDPGVWYGANRVAGRDLAIGGASMAVIALLVAVALPGEIPLERGLLVPLLLPVVPLLLSGLHTFWSVSVWLADHDAVVTRRARTEASPGVRQADLRRRRTRVEEGQ